MHCVNLIAYLLYVILCYVSGGLYSRKSPSKSEYVTVVETRPPAHSKKIGPPSLNATTKATPRRVLHATRSSGLGTCPGAKNTKAYTEGTL